MFVQMADANALSLLLETYLRKVTNCEAVMGVLPVRERVLGFLGLEDGRDIVFKMPVASLQGVKIGKTEATKAMVGDNFETLFGFRATLSSSRLIRKTRGDFLELHADSERWLCNRKSSCGLDFPKDGPCEAQHLKLLSYLQQLVSLEDSHRNYSLVCFLDLCGSDVRRTHSTEVVDGSNYSLESSKRFSHILDNLGQDE
jgi:hypothetical protein